MIGGVILTPWQVAGFAFAMSVYAVAWTWGGRVERFAASVLIVDLLVTRLTFNWIIGDAYLPAEMQDCVRLMIFGWLCFRSNRWWLLLITTAEGLMVFMDGARWLSPAVSHMALASSHVGLLYLEDLALLLGVFERWLAGEPPAGPAAWAKADRVTTWRRDRPGRPPGQPAGSSIP